jgi:ribosomal protein L37AE/L43A
VVRTPHLQFHDRYVEKNFLACHLPGLGLYSLGVRPAVLRLELCHRERLEHLGTLVPAEMTPQMALSQGLQTAKRQRLVTRQVLGRVLSVIYFPYWIVEVKRQDHTMLSLVDAVCGKVVQIAAPCHLYTVLHRQRTTALQVVQFRPLVCPNCGWDLPYRSEDIIFFCTACDQAWQMVGSDLRTMAYQVVDIALGATGDAVTYLPFWCLQAHAPLPGVNTYWMPAFRYRRLKRLVDLATRLTLQQPPYRVMTGPKPALHGCFYDAHDAIRLAQFTHVGLMRKSPQHLNLAQPPAFARGRLTWVPFRHQGRDLVDPWTNFPLPRHLLI